MDASVVMRVVHGVSAAVHVVVVSPKPIAAHGFGKAVCAPDISRLACLLCPPQRGHGGQKTTSSP